MRTTSVLLAALAGSVANALPSANVIRSLPEVTAVERPRECSSYPTFNAATGAADPFTLFADSTEEFIDPRAGATFFSAPADGQGIGRLNIAQRIDVAKSVIRCVPEEAPEGLQTLTANGWKRITMGGSVDQTHVLVDLGPWAHYPMTAYSHFLADGTQQTGTFLGYNGTTTWAFAFETSPSSVTPEYRIRLLQPNDLPLQAGEFRGFVRAGWSYIDA